MRIAVVEDDAALARGLANAFHAIGLVVDHFTLGEDLLAMAASEDYGAIVLDLGLPDLDGIDVLRALRKKGVRTPVLILTARDAPEALVAALDIGADDFLAKPFDPPELEARVRALIRRGKGMSDPTICAGSLTLNLSTRTISANGVPVDLRRREHAVLETLMLRAGKVVSRDRIAAEVFGLDDEVAPNALEVQVARLRRKIAGTGQQIRTVRGLGYILDASCGIEA